MGGVSVDKFVTLIGTAAPLLTPNVNTDILIRVERMIDLRKGEFGSYCFEAWRYRADGSENPDFVLNEPARRGACILIAGANFGCGSSREPAVWALLDMGIRCVIAPSFGDIFFGNCFQNGLLPVVLPEDAVLVLAAQAGPGAAPFTVDLQRERIIAPDGSETGFTVEPIRRKAMLGGLDELAITDTMEADIAAFEARDTQVREWIHAV